MIFPMIKKYPLLLSLLFLAFAAQAEDAPFTLEADEVTYSEDGNTVTASGNVFVSSDAGTVMARSIIYDGATGALTAEGNVTYTDDQGQVLSVQRLELSGDMKNATLEAISFRLPELGEILTAGQATRRDEHRYELTDITYSPCKNCVGDRKPWQIRAKSVLYDAEEEIMTYKGAKFDVLGVPIVYLPYFYHPVGEKPKTGILPPSFGSSTARGDEITLSGYIFNEKSNSDYTLRTRLMSERGAQLMLERRQKTLHWDTELRGSAINDTNLGSFRGHGHILGEYVMQPGRRLGINAEFSSDDDYLYDYFDRNDPYLPSTAYFEDSSQEHYIGAYTRWYQDLDSTHVPADTSHALPHLMAEKVWALDNAGTQVKASGDFFTLHRGEGVRYQRLSTEVEYEKPFMLSSGSLIDVTASLRGDLYLVDGDGTTNSAEAGRLIPEVTLGWEKPFVSPNGNHTITPRVMGVLTSRSGNPDDIPNEDSAAYELDTTNLFQSNRFAGLDRVETGPQLIYGVDNRWGYAGEPTFQVFLGQTLREYQDDALPTSGGTATKFSDWVGFMRGKPSDWFEFHTGFRLDNATFNARRLDSGVTVGENTSDDDGRFFRVTHTYLDEGPEELNANGRWTFNDAWATTARIQQNLAATDGEARNLLSEGSLVYTHECFRLHTIVRRRGFTNSTTQPSTDYLLNFELLTLGKDRE